MAESFSPAEAAERSGLEPAYFDKLVRIGLLSSSADGRFSKGQARRAQLVHTLERAGIPLDGLAAGVKRGQVSLDFVELEVYERFAALSAETFAQVSARTGIPFETLATIREAIGLALPSPEDRVREDELLIIPFVEAQVRFGFRRPATERLLRVTGEAMRRITEQEADWWTTEVLEPAIQAGAVGEALGGRLTYEQQDELIQLANKQLLALYDARRAHAWTSNIIGVLEQALTRAGLYSRLERPPAICFLDITGYTRLTQDRGDAAAADLAQRLNRLVQQAAGAHAGRAIKWLGDGVMLYFNDPVRAVRAALDMIDGVGTAGLPPAHVGIHAGPVLFQEGDYFGTTVNVAARIADYARPGEVLVSQAVVEHAADVARFERIGPVELKGVRGAMELYRPERN